MDVFFLTALFLLVIAMPVAALAVRWLDLMLPRAEAGWLIFIAALVPAALLLLACIVRMKHTRSEDFGVFIAIFFAFGGVPLSLLLGVIAARLTLRRERRNREE